MHSHSSSGDPVELDDILLELGSTGKFQIKNYVFFSIPIIASAFYTMSYVFTALNPQYRCLIPECEGTGSQEFIPHWLEYTVPFKGNFPKRCKRYHNKNLTSASLRQLEACNTSWFDPSVEEDCFEFFINSKHTSIVNDFHLFCENLWKVRLPGTIHNIGQFCGMSITGIFSDRFGRKTTLILCIVLSSICGLLRSFSPNYLVFVSFEFLDAMLGSGTYISAFILATEFVRPEKRVLASTLQFCTYPIGEAILGVIAWNVLDWRNILRIIYAPGLLALVYIWMLPESVRWLISKGRHHDAKNILEDAALQNKLTLSTRAFASLENSAKHELTEETNECQISLNDVCKNITLLTRFVICITCWITGIFVFYGLSLNSVEIAGNLYLNFILVSLAEIPGNLAFGFFLDRYGRRYSSSGSYLLAGLSCILFIFVDSTQSTLKLILFLIGKSSITMATSVIYVYTAELFPTPLRHTMVSMCAMFGRLGSMIAPQMPLLANLIWVNFPILSFGFFSILSGFLVLTFPETVNAKLPDTIEEAAEIGKHSNKNDQNSILLIKNFK